jgi:hypothetical protein
MKKLITLWAALVAALFQPAHAGQIGVGYSIGEISTYITGSGGPPPFVAPTAPVFYDFTESSWITASCTTACTANGQNGWTTLQDLAGAGSSAAVKINTTAGYLYGSSANQAWHGAKSITTGDGWYRVTVIGSATLEMQRNMVGGSDSFTGVKFLTGVTGVLASSVRIYQNGTSVTTMSLQSGAAVMTGDVYEFYTDSTNHRLIPYMNGRQLTLTTLIPTSGIDISTLTITGQNGIIGNAGTTGALDDMEFGDTTMGMIRLYQPTRVAQREANGDLVLTLEGTYTKSDPAALKYNITTSAKVAVQTAQALQSPVIGSGAFSGKAIQFTPAASTSYVTTVYRDDAVSGGVIKSHGPYVMPGEIDFGYGQSNMGNSYAANSATVAWTPPANAFIYDVSTTVNTPAGDSLIKPYTTTNSAVAAALYTLAGSYGGVPVALIEGGVGSTTIEQRSPGGSSQAWWDALLNGIRMGGRRLRYGHWADGESNASGSYATYASTFMSDLDLIDAQNGRPVVILMGEMGSYQLNGDTANNTPWEAVRRIQAKLANDNPTRIKVASYRLDAQHLTSGSAVDSLHHSSDSYAIFWRRQMMMRAYLDGKSAYHLLGPSVVSVVKNSNTQVTVTFALNGMTGMRYINTAYGVGGTEYHGGMRFASSAANLVIPANWDTVSAPATIGTPSGGQVTVTFTLTSAIAGAIYVGLPWGENPYNPTNDNTVNLNFRTQASILAGYISGEEDVGIQPFYCLAGASNDNSTAAGCTPGNDYLIAS